MIIIYGHNQIHSKVPLKLIFNSGNFQSMSTQHVHESSSNPPTNENYNNLASSSSFKILNGYVLVKDQVHVRYYDNDNNGTDNNGAMLLSTIHTY